MSKRKSFLFSLLCSCLRKLKTLMSFHHKQAEYLIWRYIFLNIFSLPSATKRKKNERRKWWQQWNAWKNGECALFWKEISQLSWNVHHSLSKGGIFSIFFCCFFLFMFFECIEKKDDETRLNEMKTRLDFFMMKVIQFLLIWFKRRWFQPFFFVFHTTF